MSTEMMRAHRIVSIFLLCAAFAVRASDTNDAQPSTSSERLSVIVLPSDNAGTARIAVRWQGEPTDRYSLARRQPDGRIVALVPSAPLGPGMKLNTLSGDQGPGRLLVTVTDKDGKWLASREVGLHPEGAGTSSAGWQPLFYGPGLDGPVHAAVVWDDGSGPALYVGGEFRTAGKHVANNIARWDGAEWTALGRGVRRPDDWFPRGGDVRALAVHGGELIVGGHFALAGEVEAACVARWNGTAWTSFGPELESWQQCDVNALATFDGDLIVAGDFSSFSALGHIARWDVQSGSWQALAGPAGAGVTGINEAVHALVEHDGVLVAGGDFNAAGGIAAHLLAQWDGMQWSPVPGMTSMSEGGFPTRVMALASFNGDLVVAGRFTTTAGLTTNNIARWDGGQWHAMGDGMTSGTGGNVTVHSLVAMGGALYAGGDGDVSGGTAVNGVARWNGTDWTALDSGTSGSVQAMAVFDGGLYVGGDYSRAAGNIANHLARWDGGGWSILAEANGGTGLDGAVRAATIYQGDLVVGGDFSIAGTDVVNHIARWNGTAWSAFGPAVSPGVSRSGDTASVYALHVHGNDLIAAGAFDAAGGVPAANIARWNGAAWLPLLAGTDGTVHALATYGNSLYAGGAFMSAGGIETNHVAQWDGASWSHLPGTSGMGVDGPVRAMTTHANRLIVGGAFASAGGDGMAAVAAWDGAQWNAMDGLDGTVIALAEHEDELFAGRSDSGYLYRWDGSEWQLPGGMSGSAIDALASHEGSLAVAGDSLFAGSDEDVRGIGRWNKWEGGLVSLGGEHGAGYDHPYAKPHALAVYGDLLIVGSSERLAGGIAGWNLAAWRSEEVQATILQPSPAAIFSPWPIAVRVVGEATAPLQGRVWIRSSGGEACIADAAIQIDTTTAEYRCDVTFTAFGSTQLDAQFFRPSSVHRIAAAPPVQHEVVSQVEIVTLADLSVSEGTLVPAFSEDVVEYAVSVGADVASVSLTATTGHPSATVTIDGTATPSGVPSEPIALGFGTNAIAVTVSSQVPLAQRSYVVSIERQPPKDAVLHLSVERLAPGLAGSPVKGGALAAYRITATNFGAGPLVDIRLQARVESGLGGVLWDCEVVNGSCDPPQGAASIDTRFDLAAGGSASVDVSGNVEASASFVVMPVSALSDGQDAIHADSLLLIDAIDGRGLLRSGFEGIEATPP